MSRKLIKQAATQWRSNIWLTIEMMIVATAVWYLTDMVFLIYGQRNLPNGYHIENTAMAKHMQITGGPLFEAVPEGTDTLGYYRQGFDVLLGRLRDLPMVEIVGYGSNAMPYNYNFVGNEIHELDRGDSLAINGNTRMMSPEMVDILQLEPIDGHSREDLKAMLEKKIIILVRNSVRASTNEKRFEHLRPPFELIGQRFFYANDSSNVYTIGAVVEDVRRNDYEPVYAGNLIMRLPDDRFPSQIAVKVKPGRMGEFLEYFQNHRGEFTACNVTITGFDTVDSIRDANQRDIREARHRITVILAFLLISVFLGILGTFWFRTQERTGEIAIRKVNGATNADIMRRLIGEGLLLLVAGTVLSVGLDWLLIHLELGDFGDWRDPYIPGYGVWQAYPRTLGLTFGIMCLMVVAGVYFPARRAMKIDPATALHDE